jgi:hypothetical protein
MLLHAAQKNTELQRYKRGAKKRAKKRLNIIESLQLKTVKGRNQPWGRDFNHYGWFTMLHQPFSQKLQIHLQVHHPLFIYRLLVVKFYP